MRDCPGRKLRPDETSVPRRGRYDSTLLAVKKMKLFARLEANRLARGNADLGAGTRVASDAGLARTNVEDAKTTQLDPLTLSERALQRLKDGIHSCLRFVALQASALNHLVNDVLFYQDVPPSGAVSVSA